jgi:hypothetical protein
MISILTASAQMTFPRGDRVRHASTRGRLPLVGLVVCTLSLGLGVAVLSCAQAPSSAPGCEAPGSCINCVAPAPCGLFVCDNDSSYYEKGCEASADGGEE